MWRILKKKYMVPHGWGYIPFQHLRQAQNLSHKCQSWPQSQDLLSQLNRQVPLLKTISCFKSFKVLERHQSYSHCVKTVCGLPVHQDQIHKTCNSLSVPEQYMASVWCKWKKKKKLKRCKSIILFDFFPRWMNVKADCEDMLQCACIWAFLLTGCFSQETTKEMPLLE